MKIELTLKELIQWLLILGLIVFCVVIWTKMGTLKLANQVQTNTQSIQNIVTFLQGQQKAALPMPPMKKEKQDVGNE